jgi:hypothetical protein
VLGAAALFLTAMTRTEVVGPREPLATLPLSLVWQGATGRSTPACSASVRTNTSPGLLAAREPWVSHSHRLLPTQRQADHAQPAELHARGGLGACQQNARDRSGDGTATAMDPAGSTASARGLDRQLSSTDAQAHGRIVAKCWEDLHGGGRHQLNRSDGSMVRHRASRLV